MFGTYLTCRGKLTMSVNRGKADLALGRVEVSVCPEADMTAENLRRKATTLRSSGAGNDKFVQGFQHRNAVIGLGDDRHVYESVAHREILTVAGSEYKRDGMGLCIAGDGQAVFRTEVDVQKRETETSCCKNRKRIGDRICNHYIFCSHRAQQVFRIDGNKEIVLYQQALAEKAFDVGGSGGDTFVCAQGRG